MRAHREQRLLAGIDEATTDATAEAWMSLNLGTQRRFIEEYVAHLRRMINSAEKKVLMLKQYRPSTSSTTYTYGAGSESSDDELASLPKVEEKKAQHPGSKKSHERSDRASRIKQNKKKMLNFLKGRTKAVPIEQIKLLPAPVKKPEAVSSCVDTYKKIVENFDLATVQRLKSQGKNIVRIVQLQDNEIDDLALPPPKPAKAHAPEKQLLGGPAKQEKEPPLANRNPAPAKPPS